MATELPCFDLRTQRAYRVFYGPDHVPGCRVEPWNLELRGSRGRVYPHGGATLQAYSDHRRLMYKVLAVHGVKVWQDCDREFTVTFPVEGLGPVAEVLKLYRRRLVTDEERARLAARLGHGSLTPESEDDS